MAWITPVTSWVAGNGIGFSDMNRIEGDLDYIYNTGIKPNTDASWSVGRGKVGLASNGITDSFYIGHHDFFIFTMYGLRINGGNETFLNSSVKVYIRNNNASIATFSGLAITLDKSTTLTGDLTLTGAIKKAGSVILETTADSNLRVVDGISTITVANFKSAGSGTFGYLGVKNLDMFIGNELNNGTLNFFFFFLAIRTSKMTISATTISLFNPTTITGTTGTLFASGVDQDVTNVLGRSALYSATSDIGYLSHYDRQTTSGHALAMTTSGNHFFNSLTTGSLTIAGTTKLDWNAADLNLQVHINPIVAPVESTTATISTDQGAITIPRGTYYIKGYVSGGAVDLYLEKYINGAWSAIDSNVGVTAGVMLGSIQTATGAASGVGALRIRLTFPISGTGYAVLSKT